VIVENTDANLDQVVGAVTELIARAHQGQMVTGGSLRLGAPAAVPAPIESVAAAYQAFLAWVDRRAFREPLLAAYVLAGISGAEIDARRMALAGAAPKVIARGLRGLSDAVSWRLRRLLLEAAPAEVALSLEDTAAEANEAWTLRELLADTAPAAVASSLEGLDDETAWALRAELYDRAPDTVLASLALLDGPRAWEMRTRWVSERGGLDRACDTYERARALAKSVTGLDGAQAWDMRKATRDLAPVAALTSLKGTTSDRAWSWRDKAIGRAPKAVLSTIAGMDDTRAWALRVANAQRCREALDSMAGIDHPIAWDLRETCADIWPANTIKSLGVLVSGQRGHQMLLRALAAHADQISLLKQAAGIATGAHLTPSVMAA
jgi:dTMP kinase